MEGRGGIWMLFRLFVMIFFLVYALRETRLNCEVLFVRLRRIFGFDSRCLGGFNDTSLILIAESDAFVVYFLLASMKTDNYIQ